MHGLDPLPLPFTEPNLNEQNENLERSPHFSIKKDPLYQAVKHNKTLKVTGLLQDKMIRDKAHAYDNYALKWAAKRNHFELVQVLLQIPKVKENAHVHNNAILIETARYGYDKIVQELLKIPQVKETAYAQANSALAAAVTNGHLKIVQTLLQIDTVRNLAHYSCNNILQMATTNGHKEVVLELLKIPQVYENLHFTGSFILLLSIKLDYEEISLELLKIDKVRQFADIERNGPLIEAALRGREAIVQELLKIERVSATVSRQDCSLDLLKKTVQNNQLAILNILLQVGSIRKHITANDNQVLKEAITKGHLAIVQTLLKIDAVREMAQNNPSALFAAVQSKNEHIAVELLQVIPFRNYDSLLVHSILLEAAASGFNYVVRKLLKSSVAKEIADINDNEIIKKAIELGQLGVVQTLLELPRLRKTISENNNCIFNLALATHRTSIVLELLKIKEVQEKVQLHGNELLLQIANYGNLTLTKALLKLEGIRENVHAQNNSILVEAANFGHPLVVQELLEITKVKENTRTSIYPFIAAATKGQLTLLQLLLKINCIRQNAAINENEALRAAASKNQGPIILELLKLKAVRDQAAARENEAFIQIAASGSFMALQALLEIPAVKNNAQAKSNKALRLAAANGHLTIVKALLKIPAVRENAHIKHNMAFVNAASNGHIAIVLELLKLPKVHQNAASCNNEALIGAVTKGSLELVKILLKIPAIQENAHTRNNIALRKAVKHSRIRVALALLKITEVKKNAHIRNNELLIEAMKRGGHFKLIKKLLRLKKVRDTAHLNKNRILGLAIKHGHESLVANLLEIPNIQASLHDYHNKILQEAIKCRQTELSLQLLQISTVRDTAHYRNRILREALRQNELPVVEELFKIKNVQKRFPLHDLLHWATSLGHLAFIKSLLKLEWSVSTLSEEMLIYLVKLHPYFASEILNTLLFALGRAPISKLDELKNSTVPHIVLTTLEEHLKNPLSFNSLQALAKMLLVVQDDYLNIGKSEFEELEGNTESSIDDKLLKKGQEDFAKRIRPALQAQFESLGNKLNERLEQVEFKIRRLILKEIQAFAKADEDLAIFDFIEAHQDKILEDDLLLSEARQCFISNTIPAQIAWRCYDKGAENYGWANLFVPPENEEAAKIEIFSTCIVSDKPLSLQEGSDRVRELAAYCMLAIESEPLPERKKDMEADFIYYLAEIKRANNSNIAQIDDPSCFPGALLRLYYAFMKSSLLLQDSKKQEVLEQLLLKAMKKALQRCFEKESSEKMNAIFSQIDAFQTRCEEFSDALTGLTEKNALNFLCGQTEIFAGYGLGKPYTKNHLEARLRFFQETIKQLIFPEVPDKNGAKNFEQVLGILEKKLKANTAEWSLSPTDQVYIKFFILSLSNVRFLNCLSEVYKKTFPPPQQEEPPEKEKTPFEGRLSHLYSLWAKNPQFSHLEKRCQGLTLQNQLFKKIKMALVDQKIHQNKNYLDDELEKLVNELSAIPTELRLLALKEMATQKEGWLDSQPSNSNQNKVLSAYIQALREYPLLIENLNLIIAALEDFEPCHSPSILRYSA